MLWFLATLAVGVGGGWWIGRRTRPSATAAPPQAAQVAAAPRRSGPPDRKTMLRRAFHSDEYQVPEDAAKGDDALLAQALRLLADHVGAREVVLWQFAPDGGGHLVPVSWVPNAEPPALPESERLLLQLGAETETVTFNSSGPLKVMAVGVRQQDVQRKIDHRHVVSLHFREEPAMERDRVEEWLRRHAQEVTALQEVILHRGALAARAYKLRHALQTAITLQESRDPEALEKLLAANASEVAGANWAFIVRWDAFTGTGRVVERSEFAPSNIGEGITITQASMVGRVCAGVESSRVYGDTRAVIVAKEALLDDTPVPSGTKALVVAPLRRAPNVAPVGALVVGRTERGAFTIADANAALALGTLGAGALETAWAMRDEAARALTDQLTGLPNRRAFEHDFARFVAETDRFGGASALVMVDVDHFKRVNDTYGHEVGDRVLQAVAKVLLDQRRTTDRLARLGGEEMAMLLPQTDAAGAAEVAERCRRAIEDVVVQSASGPVRVTASFGVAVYRARSQGGDRMYDRADRALYAAKHGGRNRVEIAADE